MRLILGLVFVDAVILMIWSTKDPLKWIRTVDMYADNTVDFPLSSNGQCESDDAAPYFGLIAALHAFVMVYASFLCYKSRNIPTKFAEGKYVALAMASNLEVFLLGIPVMIIVGNDPSTSFFVRSAIIFLNDFAVICFIFGNLTYSFYFGVATDGKGGTVATAATSNHTNSNNSKVNVSPTQNNRVAPALAK